MGSFSRREGCYFSEVVDSFHDFVLARCPPNVRAGIEPANLSLLNPVLLFREKHPTDIAPDSVAFFSLRCVLFKKIRRDLLEEPSGLTFSLWANDKRGVSFIPTYYLIYNSTIHWTN
jgi:hypothetical protein